MEKIHNHPLNPSEFCCPEHIFELLSIYTRQNREEEVLPLLLFFSESLDTKFLLDNSDWAVDLKLKFGKLCNKNAMSINLPLPTVRALFETAFNLFSSLPESKEASGYLATATSNLAFVAKQEGDLEKACRLLENSLKIEKKIGDSTGEIMTRINKSAILNEMEAFRESFFTIKDSVEKLEKKISNLINSKPENELKKSKQFKETLQLMLIASVNLITSLENIEEISDAGKKRINAYELSQNYLGGSHYLTKFFEQDSFKPNHSFSSYSSNIDIGSFRSSSKEPVTQSLDFKDKKNKGPFDSRMKYEDEKAAETYNETMNFKVRQPSPSIKKSQNDSRSSKSFQSQSKKNSARFPNIRKNESVYSGSSNSKEVDKLKSEDNEKPSKKNENIFEVSETALNVFNRIPYKSGSNFSTFGKVCEDGENEKWDGTVKIIRLPGTPLPFIPFRPCDKKNTHSWRLTKIVSNDNYEYLLDPLLSPIAKQFDFNIAGIKTVKDLRRIIIFCLVTNNSIPNLSITASSEDSYEELFTSEYININDLKRILFFLCINDVMPSYMHPKFVNSFEKFCRFFLMPFIRISEIQENQSEKLELWARGESLLTLETPQLFLNTQCNISLYYVEKFTLKLVICSSSDEESNEKCIRVDIVLDEVSAASLIQIHSIPLAYNNIRFVQCIKNISQSFIEVLDPIISEIELCIKDDHDPRITFEEYIEKSNYIYLRANINGTNSDKILWIVQDQREKLGWDIKIKRLHKVNSSGRKRSFSTTFFYSYNALYVNFGVLVDQLDFSKTLILAFFVIESMKLELSAEGTEDLENNGYVISLPVKMLKSFRTFVVDNYVAPVTLSIVGVNNCLIGIRVSLFNVETCIEGSAWLILDGNFYKHDQPKVKKVEKPKGVLSVKLHETKLVEILEKERGWERIMSCVKVSKNNIFINAGNGDTVFESLENALIKGK